MKCSVSLSMFLGNIQLRTVQWATGAFGAAVPSPASLQYESVSVTQSSSLKTVDNPVAVWKSKPAAGSIETNRATNVDSTQAYKPHIPWFKPILPSLLALWNISTLSQFCCIETNLSLWLLHNKTKPELLERLNIILSLGPAFITSMEFGKGRSKHDNYGNPLDSG